MSSEKTSSEPKRGCGFRQVGKLYLIGEGVGFKCPSLPLPFDECECCGYTPSFYRDFQWIRKAYIKHIRRPTGQACQPECPICYGVNDQLEYGLMWVGRKFYTPEEFIAEDKTMGICKAIKQIPKGLVLGKTWIVVAHPQAVETHEEPAPGVFYAFIPTRIEMLVYESQATPEYLQELEAKGITPIIVLDKHTAHSRRTRTVRGRANIA
ncbi:hypothetical protein ES703_06902 [subsurface metagenome]